MNPFFSVIIPAYNREYLIEETIKSVISQTFENWECIVVDDGSTDNTRNVILSLSEKDQRIKYIYQENAERSAARNNGIRNAKGEYICFLDSDDFYTCEHLQSLQKEISSIKNPIGLFFTGFEEIKKNERHVPPINEFQSQNGIDYFLTNAIIPARICGHKLIFKEQKFDEDIVIVEDLCLWARIASKFPVYQLKQNTVLYSIHEGNSIHLGSNASEKKLRGLKTFIKRYPEIIYKADKKNVKRLLTDCHFRIAQSCIHRKLRFGAFRHTLISIFLNVDKTQLKHKLYVLMNLMLFREIPEYMS
jgi:glycosyltransferase involved in cell wall biosynthesis